MYNYKEAVKNDVRNWIADNEPEMDYDVIFDGCWTSDSVTGNGSGSYTFSRYDARMNFFDDTDSDEYIHDMLEDGFITEEDIGKNIAGSNWEWIDVSIRCYLLSEAVQEVIDEMD